MNNYDPGSKIPETFASRHVTAFSRFFCSVFILLAVLAFSPGCTKRIPREKLPPPLTNEHFPSEVKVVSVPLPVIGTTPNEGPTLGALTAFLLHDSKDEVNTLVASQLNFNRNFGITGAVYGAFYTEPDRSWEVNLAKSANVNEDYEVRFIDHDFKNRPALDALLYSFTDGSARFFGFQSTSIKANETNYGDQELGLTLSVEFPIRQNIRLLIGERIRNVAITQGAVENIPQIRDLFAPEQVPGINGFLTHAQKAGLVFTTLDSPTFPTSGDYARAALEVSSKLLGSSDNYRHYDIEIKSYLPLGQDARYITVLRAAYNQTLGENVPFLERSILGGEKTLRGYGRNRFIDSSYFLFNFEERIRLFRWKVFNVNADWEIAPFVDLGAVVESLAKVRSNDLQFNPGIGFRASVRPNIVGRVDLGFGDEGVAVFVGLGYPF